MIILKTKVFDEWFRKLRNGIAKAKINARLRRIELNNEIIGDYKIIGEKVIELRFNTGPGYRVYITKEGDNLVVLLIGGDKSSQDTDIDTAKRLAKEWRSKR
ncbi:MAG: type II toxin-antitoxin system RelE/ParE family toxin [Eggerthellaceae bacterium]|jgi:putative addiction module killer protein|nr:type II toxin-antitoxin system RelE/ParE family toxin [Eggerthellaceae bacterium]MCH4221343.1 type II toxin-antitoxin system RelE/ParE family toxin [Eggerthellaceae bacterium]